MNRHWDNHLRVKDWILSRKPTHVVEIGALEGANTEHLKSLRDYVGYKLTVISDDLEMKDDGVTRIQGISYKEIPKLEDDSIDLCILDTDHNYWTMMKELTALHPKLRENSLLMIHDVETFYHANGMGMCYANGDEYPLVEIESHAKALGSMSHAVLDFLHLMRNSYKLLMWIPFEDGVCVIEKNKKDVAHVDYVAIEGESHRKGSMVG